MDGKYGGVGGGLERTGNDAKFKECPPASLWLPAEKKKLTHGTVGSNKRSVKTGSTMEETFPGQANKTSSTFFPLPEIHWKNQQSVKNTPKRCKETKIPLLFNWQ